jgi:hypothetical protein
MYVGKIVEPDRDESWLSHNEARRVPFNQYLMPLDSGKFMFIFFNTILTIFLTTHSLNVASIESLNLRQQIDDVDKARQARYVR